MSIPKKKISELFSDVKIGGTPSRGNPVFFGGRNLWVSIKDMERQPLITKTAETISDEGARNSNCKLVKKGSLLFSFKLTVGRVSFAGADLYTNEAIAAFDRDEAKLAGLDLEYLALVLPIAARGDTTKNSMGAALLNKEKIFNLEIPFLEFDEQRRIAARIKAQLAEVETARQAAQAQVRDAAQLRNRLLQQAFDALHDAPCKALHSVAEVAAGITLGRKTNESELIEVPYMRVANVKDGVLDVSYMKTVKATAREIEKLALRAGDLLLTEGGDLDKLGRGACWRNQLPLCIHQNHIFRVRLPSNCYDPDFVSFQVGSPYGKAYFFAHAKKTTGIASINQRVLGAFPLLSPSIDEQRRIVARLKAQLAEADAIARGAAAQLAEIERLPQKLLAQAFAVQGDAT